MVVSSRRRVRCVGVVGACAVSLAAGLGLVFRLVTPQSIAILGTPELLGLLALLVMPVCIGAAMRMHREHESGQASEARPAAETARMTDPAMSPAAQRIVLLAPDLRDRSADRHRRRVVHRSRAKGHE